MPARSVLEAMAAALDGVEIACCVFDDDDRTLLWNRSFLAIFPEHAGHVFEGEPYSANLRRFYQHRLEPQQLHDLDDYIARGVARHREQRRPYTFDHRGWRIQVSSVELPAVGRVRLWRRLGATSEPPRHDIDRGSALAAGDASLLDRMADGVLVIDPSDRIVWANEAFVELYGLRGRDAAVGRRFDDIYRELWERRTGDGGAPASGLAMLDEQLRFSGAPFELALPDERWVRVAEQRGDDKQSYFTHVDITALKRKQHALARAEQRAREGESKLEALATTDALTGIANRRRFDQKLDSEWRRAAREPGALTLMMVDVDHFKALNDRHGHLVGDTVLKRVAGVVAGFAQRAADLVARYGGEEFALILPNTAGRAGEALAERLRGTVERTPIEVAGVGELRVTVSIGLCCVDRPDAAGDVGRLLEAADAALYRAKRAGRNRVVATTLGG